MRQTRFPIFNPACRRIKNRSYILRAFKNFDGIKYWRSWNIYRQLNKKRGEELVAEFYDKRAVYLFFYGIKEDELKGVE